MLRGKFRGAFAGRRPDGLYAGSDSVAWTRGFNRDVCLAPWQILAKRKRQNTKGWKWLDSDCLEMIPRCVSGIVPANFWTAHAMLARSSCSWRSELGDMEVVFILEIQKDIIHIIYPILLSFLAQELVWLWFTGLQTTPCPMTGSRCLQNPKPSYLRRSNTECSDSDRKPDRSHGIDDDFAWHARSKTVSLVIRCDKTCWASKIRQPTKWSTKFLRCLSSAVTSSSSFRTICAPQGSACLRMTGHSQSLMARTEMQD